MEARTFEGGKGSVEGEADRRLNVAATPETRTSASATSSQGAEPSSPLPGYYYVDISGKTQGPFTSKQLAAWQGHLPDDLQIWHTDGRQSTCCPLQELLSADQLRSPPVSSSDERDISYAEAALAGLPEGDRELAKLAAERGTSLSEIVNFCYGASRAAEPTPSIETEGEGDQETEEQKCLPPSNWKQLKKQRAERKEKQRTAWLYS